MPFAAASTSTPFDVTPSEPELTSFPAFAYFHFLVGLCCLWVLSLPAFVTQDGSMHLYYVEAIRKIFLHDTVFSTFYSLRLPPPPYAMHYLLLGGLSCCMPYVWAEKILVCGILLISSYGFRSLAATLGESYEVASLWAVPLFLSWPLFMGFHNFCLSLGLALWAWSFWNRAVRGRGRRYIVLFLVTSTAVAFTHPVPLGFLGSVAVLDCVRCVIDSRHPGYQRYLQSSKVRTAIALAAWMILCLAYIRLFVEARPQIERFQEAYTVTQNLQDLLKLRWMTADAGSPVTVLHRILLLLLLVGSVALASTRNLLRRLVTSPRLADVPLVFALVLLAGWIFIPASFNGLDYFAARLLTIVWVAALAAASVAPLPSRRWQAAMAGAALGFTLLTIYSVNGPVRTAGQMIADAKPLMQGHGSRGLIFISNSQYLERRLNFNPYAPWLAGRYFAETGTLMLNDPFTDPPNILPLRRRADNSAAMLTATERVTPGAVHDRLVQSVELRRELLAQADVLVFVAKPNPGEKFHDALLDADPGRRWACEQTSALAVCYAQASVTATD